MGKLKKLINALIAISMTIALPAFAGSAQTSEIKHSVESVEKFAKQVERYAANKGARAFIIGRVGRPESELPKGIKFTHTAIAIYSSIELDTGEIVKGYAVHNLYQKEGQLDKSELIIDYPVDFFWGVDALKAGIIIPAPALQERIIALIAEGKDSLLHNENYSVIANPFNNEFQNCTEHTLNIVNASIYQTTDVTQLKANTKAHFKPQRIKVNPVKLMLGNIFVDDVSTSDHGRKIYTTTFTSIGGYLQENELLSEAVVLTPEGEVSQLL
ncbi:DUF2145 domain-containing protein [Thalassotalea sp. LPB0316]|uniref:DUF2145 domain-containing protein n=1 Tax=Thalassotalea sp. LPB0316 TaxID=2769490 RepID=UPI001868461F|nr:DUF2145 domain-containing protein [Thalassotalea sp. LPB0316]QOL25616.1 DUF2145 domain-containing protein [Thalassotalea sp. LPB0316]